MNLFLLWAHGSWLGMAQRWSLLDQKWPDMASKWSKRVQNGQPNCFDNSGPFRPIWTLLDNFRLKMIVFPSFFRCLVKRTFPFFYLSPSSWSHDKPAGQGRMFSSSGPMIFVLILDFLTRFSSTYSRHHIIIITINAVYITTASPNLGFFDEVKFYMMSLVTSGRILWYRFRWTGVL